MLRWKKGARRRKEGKREKKKRVDIGTIEEREEEEGGVGGRKKKRKGMGKVFLKKLPIIKIQKSYGGSTLLSPDICFFEKKGF